MWREDEEIGVVWRVPVELLLSMAGSHETQV